MLFVELRFFFFFLVAYGVHRWLSGPTSRKAWLLTCSYAFYAAWDWRFLSLIVGSTLVDYVAAQRIDRTGARRRAWLLLSLGTNLGLLGVFKYAGFFVDSAGALLESVGFDAHLPTLRIILPVGISFYTFQTLSYTLDVYAGRLKPSRKLLDVALFVGFFPQLVAGPIVRARDFLPQLAPDRPAPSIDVRAALVLFFVGFVKKACISDNLSGLVDAFYAAPGDYNALGTWTALLLYSAQIYCDFSGYTDMAIACAALLGYRLCDNFRHPYFASNLADFWRRWHISLSSWFRDYLYIPLGGNRGGLLRNCRNLTVTFVLCGLWHGAGWNFVLWGAVHAVGMCVRLLWRALLADGSMARRLVGACGLPVTFLLVTLAWVPFRAPNVEATRTALTSALTLRGAGEADFGLAALLLFGLLALAHWLAYAFGGRRLASLSPYAFTVVYALLFSVALAFVPLDARPFIYFQF